MMCVFRLQKTVLNIILFLIACINQFRQIILMRQIRNVVKCLDDLRARELDLVDELRDIEKKKKKKRVSKKLKELVESIISKI